jgi:hypothetical protein
VITAQRIATTWRPRRSRLEKTTSEGTFLEPAPNFGAAHDAGQADTCAQLTIAHICATTSMQLSSARCRPLAERPGPIPAVWHAGPRGLLWHPVPSASRGPECRETIHPFAATCPSCGADLDAHRRRTAKRRRQLAFPRITNDVTDIVVVALIMLLLALFAPLFGAVLALFIVWHAHNHSQVARRNIAIVCAAVAIFNLAAPEALAPHLI